MIPGSWADLLSTTNVQRESEDRKKDVDYLTMDDTIKQQCPLYNVEKHEQNRNRLPGCQKIYLTKDLYLETHAHAHYIKANAESKKRKKMKVGEAKTLEKENSMLRKEVFRVQSHVSASTNTSFRTSLPPAVMPDLEIPVMLRNFCHQEQDPQLHQSRKTSDAVQKKLPPLTTPINLNLGDELVSKKTDGSNFDSYLEKLQDENTALKREAANLLVSIQQARDEQQKNIKTIEKLVEYAELLNLEKQQTVDGSEEQKQDLLDKLMNACGENKLLRQKIEQLADRNDHIRSSKGKNMSPSDKHSKLRNVIK